MRVVTLSAGGLPPNGTYTEHVGASEGAAMTDVHDVAAYIGSGGVPIV